MKQPLVGKRVISVLSATIFSGLMLANAASAAAYFDSMAQTVDGQDFTFMFDPVLLSDGTDGYFTIEARGDYFGKRRETLCFNIESVFSQDVTKRDKKDVTYICSRGANDAWWTRTWTVPGADLVSITSDASGTIRVDLCSAVDAMDNNAFVSVKLEYAAVRTAAPIPGTLLLFGCGLMGIVALRRKFEVHTALHAVYGCD